MRRLAAASLAALVGCAGPAPDAGPDGVTEGMRVMSRGHYVQADPLLRREAEAGSNRAARTLGWMLERGVEVRGGQGYAANPAEALRWYALGADRGDKESALSLGAMHATGRGTPVNATEALRRFAQGGERIDLEGAWMAAYPPTDRAEVAAWMLAVRVEVQRASKNASAQRRYQSQGGVEVMLDAATGKARVVQSTGIATLTEEALATGQAALDAAPANPAARRNRAEASVVINIR